MADANTIIDRLSQEIGRLTGELVKTQVELSEVLARLSQTENEETNGAHATEPD